MSDELDTSLPAIHRSAFIVPRFLSPRLYPLTDRTLTSLTHAEQVSRLAAGGATLIQIREKHFSPFEFYEAAREAVETGHKLGVRIIINDRVDIALATGADGVHLGQDDLPAHAARHVLGEQAIIGVSTHTLAQAEEAARQPVNYIAIGPIFQTTSKANPDPVVGLDGLREVRASLPAHIPLVAIGGITAERAREVIAAGANSVAVIGAVLTKDANTITESTQNFLARLG